MRWNSLLISCAQDLAPQSIMTVARQKQKYRSRGSRCSRQQEKAYCIPVGSRSPIWKISLRAA
jgi:hypothetical protein